MSDESTSKRYLIRINFSHMKFLPKEGEEPKQKKHEYYFRTGRKSSRQRTPTRGFFEFKLNKPNVPKTPILLYSEIVKGDKGMEVEIPLSLRRKSKSPLKSDTTVFTLTMTTLLGSSPETQTVKESGSEIRITISSTETHL